MTNESQQPLSSSPRRPLKTRQRAWAQALARALTRAGISPNAISIASVFFAAFAGASEYYALHREGTMRILLFIAAAACIQLRLLANMLDGMVAIEGGRKTIYGDIFNDMPDRFADVMILAAAGYALPFCWGRDLGWLASILAVLTAYVRLLGGSMGVTQYFLGPMAKPHRMAVMTGACLLSVFEPQLGWHGQLLVLALVIVVIGSFVTLIRRTLHIVKDLKQR
jgi:phosphatidylglycerophosphate synthase